MRKYPIFTEVNPCQTKPNKALQPALFMPAQALIQQRVRVQYLSIKRLHLYSRMLIMQRPCLVWKRVALFILD